MHWDVCLVLPRKCMAPVAETRRDETRERSALGRPDISDPDFTQTSEHRTSPRKKAHHLMPYGNYLLTTSTTAALRTGTGTGAHPPPLSTTANPPASSVMV